MFKTLQRICVFTGAVLAIAGATLAPKHHADAAGCPSHIRHGRTDSGSIGAIKRVESGSARAGSRRGLCGAIVLSQRSGRSPQDHLGDRSSGRKHVLQPRSRRRSRCERLSPSGPRHHRVHLENVRAAANPRGFQRRYRPHAIRGWSLRCHPVTPDAHSVTLGAGPPALR